MHNQVSFMERSKQYFSKRHFIVVIIKGEPQAEHFTPSLAPCGTACDALNSGTTWPHMVLLLQVL